MDIALLILSTIIWVRQLIKRDKEPFGIDLLQSLLRFAPFFHSMELSIEIIDEGKVHKFY